MTNVVAVTNPMLNRSDFHLHELQGAASLAEVQEESCSPAVH